MSPPNSRKSPAIESGVSAVTKNRSGWPPMSPFFIQKTWATVTVAA